MLANNTPVLLRIIDKRAMGKKHFEAFKNSLNIMFHCDCKYFLKMEQFTDNIDSGECFIVYQYVQIEGTLREEMITT